jgi:hypothetical protein
MITQLSRPVFLAILLPLLVLGGCQPTGPPPSVLVSVLPVSPMVAPGDSLTLGWRFDLAGGWHLFWNGRNDTGLPPEVKLTLPDGWKVGPLHFPAAERFVSPGKILDHVYHRQVTLLQRIAAPASATRGTARVRAEIAWLACRDACVPGDTTLAVDIEIFPGRSPDPPTVLRTADNRLFPRPPRADELTTSWHGNRLAVTVPGAGGLEFHPAENAGEMVDPIGGATTDGSRLDLRFRIRDGRAGPARGVLRVAVQGEAPYYLSLDIPRTAIDPDNPSGVTR